jgi:hypothetical protein
MEAKIAAKLKDINNPSNTDTPQPRTSREKEQTQENRVKAMVAALEAKIET